MQSIRPGLLSSKAHDWIAIPLFSLFLLIPCFWQSRIQAADLGSHIYNAWLVSKIQQDSAPGLWLSHQSNNLLFDLMLDGLIVRVGPNLTQRFAVAISVLIFGWGAIRFIFRVSDRNWWFAGPCVAMLCYGFVFHMGFFNFYLSTGLCLWYLAVVWGRSWQLHALALPLLLLAWTAHPFPVVWAIGVSIYAEIARRFAPNRGDLLAVGGIAGVVMVRLLLTHRYLYSWSPRQTFFAAGANQLQVFGVKYMVPFAALLLLWLIRFRKLVKTGGIDRLFESIPFQLWMVTAAAVALIPDRIMFPQYALPFGFITDRLSLGAALMICAFLAAVPNTKADIVALFSVTVIFFGFLYADNRDLNRMENRLDSVVSHLPPQQRVVNSLGDQSLRSLCLQHDLDRACIGHCFSYGNYEPASRQFRVRVSGANEFVLSDFVDVDAASEGKYLVRDRDLPLSLIYPCGSNLRDFCSRPLRSGETDGSPK
jgi:hypothetical protein